MEAPTTARNRPKAHQKALIISLINERREVIAAEKITKSAFAELATNQLGFRITASNVNHCAALAAFDWPVFRTPASEGAAEETGPLLAEVGSLRTRVDTIFDGLAALMQRVEKLESRGVDGLFVK